ncbi:hypothetical protein DERP_001053 [Dermatophagoides pteronyssinus]|uniref:Uncharacterized protein n=1 Tax=Dermatophagoides pteronyssinus TaxID=6956 RepID=A0ABQ8JE49_DERPT|nr:hypothetical protein DERP_001053 [Dermatophagoides pteronyssinus]
MEKKTKIEIYPGLSIKFTQQIFITIYANKEIYRNSIFIGQHWKTIDNSKFRDPKFQIINNLQFNIPVFVTTTSLIGDSSINRGASWLKSPCAPRSLRTSAAATNAATSSIRSSTMIAIRPITSPTTVIGGLFFSAKLGIVSSRTSIIRFSRDDDDADGDVLRLCGGGDERPSI